MTETGLRTALGALGRPVVSLFTLCAGRGAPQIDLPIAYGRPESVHAVELDEDGDGIPGLKTWAFDVCFDELPRELDAFLTECLIAATATPGVRVAWLALDGGFELDDVLSPTLSEHVYGVCFAGRVPRLAPGLR